MTTNLPKILCLHGYTQNGPVFRRRIGALRREFKNIAEMIFVSGPHLLPNSDNKDLDGTETNNTNNNVDDNNNNNNNAVDPEELEQKAWWTYNEEKDIYIGYDESIAFLKSVIQEQGPFHGILGFSQGAAMTALLGSELIRDPSIPNNLKFLALVSGFKSRTAAHEHLFDSKLSIPSLHVYGETDKWVTPERSKQLIECFENPTIIAHPGGHFIPTHSEFRKQLKEFVVSQLGASS